MDAQRRREFINEFNKFALILSPRPRNVWLLVKGEDRDNQSPLMRSLRETLCKPKNMTC